MSYRQRSGITDQYYLVLATTEGDPRLELQLPAFEFCCLAIADGVVRLPCSNGAMREALRPCLGTMRAMIELFRELLDEKLLAFLRAVESCRKSGEWEVARAAAEKFLEHRKSTRPHKTLDDDDRLSMYVQVFKEHFGLYSRSPYMKLQQRQGQVHTLQAFFDEHAPPTTVGFAYTYDMDGSYFGLHKRSVRYVDSLVVCPLTSASCGGIATKLLDHIVSLGRPVVIEPYAEPERWATFLKRKEKDWPLLAVRGFHCSKFC